MHFIDTLALHKFNRLQIHLTDDQGWRIESKIFSRLHEVGSKREQSQINHYSEVPIFDSTPHSGFYTQIDLREIVRYARICGIIVVPEVDLPGHAGALLAAYPEFGVKGVKREVSQTWGIKDAVISPLPPAQEFINALLNEVMDIFPSPWIHVGGDEALLKE